METAWARAMEATSPTAPLSVGSDLWAHPAMFGRAYWLFLYSSLLGGRTQADAATWRTFFLGAFVDMTHCSKCQGDARAYLAAHPLPDPGPDANATKRAYFGYVAEFEAAVARKLGRAHAQPRTLERLELDLTSRTTTAAAAAAATDPPAPSAQSLPRPCEGPSAALMVCVGGLLGVTLAAAAVWSAQSRGSSCGRGAD